MNAYGKTPRGSIGLCPKCGMDSGERKCSVNVPEKYYVRCSSCGYIVQGSSQSGATLRWNTNSRRSRKL